CPVPAIRYSGVEFPSEAGPCGAWARQVALTVGSCATGSHQPRQVRKEAAVRGAPCVPQGCLIRANYRDSAWKAPVDDGCTATLGRPPWRPPCRERGGLEGPRW